MSSCFWNFNYSPLCSQADAAIVQMQFKSLHTFYSPWVFSSWYCLPVLTIFQGPLSVWLAFLPFQISLAHQGSCQRMAPLRSPLPALLSQGFSLVSGFHLPVLRCWHLLRIPACPAFCCSLGFNVSNPSLILKPSILWNVDTYPHSMAALSWCKTQTFVFLGSGFWAEVLAFRDGRLSAIIFLASKITADGDCIHEIKRCLFLGRKAMTNPVSMLKSRDITLPTKIHIVKAMVFSSSHVWMWELEHKESWAPKNWCFWTVLLEKTLKSPLDCKEIKPVNLKRNQSWIFIGRTDAAAETPILWPLDAKSQFIGKDPNAGKDWGQEEKETTEDEMDGWHQWLKGHEFEQTPGDSKGEGSLVCCSP